MTKSEPGSRTSVPGWRTVVAALALTTVVGGLAVAQLARDTWKPTTFRSVDTRVLVRGAEVALDCLRHGQLKACGYPADRPFRISHFGVSESRVNRFALLLYIPAGAAVASGLGGVAALRLIGGLSSLAFVVLAALPWLTRRRLPGFYRLRYGWVIVVIAGPLLPYSASTWSEVIASAFVAAAVVGAAAGWRGSAVAVLAFGAGISKETMAPFVVLLAFAAVEGRDASFRSRVRACVPILCGVAGALGANALFNIFRFGSVRNITYLAPFLHVREPQHVLAQTVSVVASPNGGIVTFWPALLPVAAYAVWVALRANDMRWRIAVIFLCVGGFALSLGVWFSPYGWHAWGSRLIMPIIPAAVVAIFVVGGRSVRAPPFLWLMLGAATILALPNVAVLTAQDQISDFMEATHMCPVGLSAAADPFVECMLGLGWRRPWLVTRVLPGLRDPTTLLFAAVCLCTGLLLAARGFLEGRLAGVDDLDHRSRVVRTSAAAAEKGPPADGRAE